MADLVVVAASVAPQGPFYQSVQGTAGAAITAGQSVYLKNSDKKWYPALAAGSVEQSGQYGAGIALDSAPGAGQAITVFVSGTIDLGVELTLGQLYVVSANAGGIAPSSDLISGNFVTILGVGQTDKLFVTASGGPLASNVTK